MRDKEGTLDVTAIGILPGILGILENLPIKLDVVVVDGIIKGNHHHLRDIFAFAWEKAWGDFTKISWNLGSVL